MTWLELKNKLRDLGFEEDTTMNATDFIGVVVNASNRAINLIRKTVVEPYEGYFKSLSNEWELLPLTPITPDTPDEFMIDIPDKVIDLVDLLASYFVWLDDDQVKATYYYNVYNDMLDALKEDMVRPRKLTFGEGLYW